MAIVNAYFNDTNKQTISVVQETKAKGQWTEVTSFLPNDDLTQKVLKKFTIADLEKNYWEFIDKETYMSEMYGQFLYVFNHGGLEDKEFVDEFRFYVQNRFALREAVQKLGTNIPSLKVEDIISIDSSKKEQLFQLKLEVFELDKVKESNDRPWKSRLRKANSALELFSELHLGLSGSADESSESQD